MRWLVDGMNVIGTRPDAWWKDRHAAMVRLVDLLENWAAASGEDVTVVFEKPPSPPIRSTVIEVAQPRARGATRPTTRSCACCVAEREPGAVRVVTSDSGSADRVHAAGATRQPAAAVPRLARGATDGARSRDTRAAAERASPIRSIGDGPLDLLFLPGWISQVEQLWEAPATAPLPRAPRGVQPR